MYRELNITRNKCQKNPYNFCKDYFELSDDIDQRKLLNLILNIHDGLSFCLFNLSKSESEIKTFRKDCIDVLSNEGILKIDKIFCDSYAFDDFIFIDYDDEYIIVTDNYQEILDYLDEIEILDNLEEEEKDEIFLFIAKNY